MQAPHDFSNLFLDMNAFFAAVEQQVQPKYRGKPICIAPYTGNTGCCIAKSYAAKAYGVATGFSVGDAKKACPKLIVLESRPELYMFYHREILRVLESFTPFLKVLSVDEFNIKLRGSDQNRTKAILMAKNLKATILDKVGDYLTCSVGIGPNAWLSKVAGELKKPDGLTIVTQKELISLYKKLKLTDLPGINFAMEHRLRQKNINTSLDFFNESLVNLSRYFGHPGRLWFYRLRGFEVDEFSSPTKSIGHQHVLAPKYRNKLYARRVLSKMAAKCSHRLRGKRLAARGIAIYIGFWGAPSWRKNITTSPLSDSSSIQKLVLKIYDECPFSFNPFRLGVTLFNLMPNESRQIALFREVEKSLQTSIAIDKINDKFGPETIHPASMCEVDDAAPNRIPFGNPERLEF